MRLFEAFCILNQTVGGVYSGNYLQGGILLRWLRTYVEKCINCGKCMETCSKTYFKEENPALSRIVVTNPGAGQNISVCNQCGACMAVCPTEALYRDKNGVVQVDKSKCTSCLMCVGFCPTGNMHYAGSKQTEPFKCVACGLCVKTCPTQALELGNC